MNYSFLIFLLSLFACAFAGELGLKTLILSASGSTEASAVKLSLNSYGIPYDHIELKLKELEGNLTLYDDDNNPKYNMIVLTSGKLTLLDENFKWVSVLSDEQWAYLDQYEIDNNIRRITLSDVPDSSLGISIYDETHWGTDVTQTMIKADNDIADGMYSLAGIMPTAKLDTLGLYHTPMSNANAKIETKPVLYFKKDSTYKENTIAALYMKLDDGRERLSFYFGFGDWSLNCIVINHIWINWGTRGIYSGFRRVYFTPHIDDVFLATELVDPKKNTDEGTEIFRTTTTDFDNIKKYQKDVVKKMNPGSFYRVELAINGNGILIEADYDQSLQVFGERLVELEFKKEPGTGTYNWPTKNYKFNFPESLLSQDKLYPYFKQKANREEFFWSSHTFTHENLDNASRSDVDNEIRVNIELAKKLGFVNEDNTHEEWWSSGSIITPQISGLRNRDAIEIFKQYGINSGTGDLSRPTLCNTENPYLPYYTTMEGSNYDGFPVIPRSPSEVYFHCSTSAENTWMYNRIYRNHFGNDTDWDTIIERESVRVLTLMMKLRHEAHQFHQANLRNADIKEPSLLQQWTDAIVEKFNSYVNWPMISLKLDDLAKTFTDRKEVEDCKATYALITSDSTVTGIKVSAEKKCTVPITVPFDVERNSKFRYEQVGNDPLTIWVPLNNSKETIIFKKPFEWGIKSPSIETTVTTIAESTEPAEPTETTTKEKKTITIISTVVATSEKTSTTNEEPTTTTEAAEETTVTSEKKTPTTEPLDESSTTTNEKKTPTTEPLDESSTTTNEKKNSNH